MPVHKGEGHYINRKSGMTDAKVREIRQKYETLCPHCGHHPTLKELGERYGVSSVMIHNIVRRHAWKHVEDLEPQPVPGVYSRDQ